MKEDQALRFIRNLLKRVNKRMTTQEIQDKAYSFLRCSDDVSHFLHRFRGQGLIKGKFSRERKGWIWWHEDEGE